MDVNTFETQMLLLSGPLHSFKKDGSSDIFPETTEIEGESDFMQHMNEETQAYNEQNSYAEDDKQNNQESYKDDYAASDDEASATDENAVTAEAPANDVEDTGGTDEEKVAAMLRDMKEKHDGDVNLDRALQNVLSGALNDQEHLQALHNFMLKKGQKQVSELMEGLLQAVPADQRQAFLTKLKAIAAEGKLKAVPETKQTGKAEIVKKTDKTEQKSEVAQFIMDSIKNAEDSEDTDEALAALVATGLSPQELAKIYEQIMNKDTGNAEEPGKGLLVAMIKIKDAMEGQDKLNLQKATAGANMSAEEAAALAGEKGKVISSFAAKLNELMTDGKAKKSGTDTLKLDLGEMAKVIEQAQNASRGQPAAQAQNAAAQRPTASTPTSLMSPAMINALNDDFISLNPASADGGVDADIAASLQAKNLNITNLGNLTNPAQNAQQASQPHPATKMVASKITKAISDGETRINIRMDPPELGRVEIRMEFNNASNSVKAVVIAEKPETYMMMQRDAHMLEKAITDSGMELGEGGIGFELASQDQNLFDHNDRGSGHGSHHSGNKSAGGEDGMDEEIIETTMDWYVDPDTGVMRYDILV